MTILESKNRYANVPPNADFSIEQDWQSYSDEEHDRWDRLYHRQKKILRCMACDHFLQVLNALTLSKADAVFYFGTQRYFDHQPAATASAKSASV